MKSVRFLDRRAGFSFVSLGLLAGMLAPGLIPAFATAGTLTTRSIAMSSSTADASGVTYSLNFTPATDVAIGGGLEVDFCADSPLMNTTCGSLSGLSTSGVALGTVKYDTTTESGASAGSVAATNSNTGIKWTAAVAYTAGTPIHIEFTSLHNPTAVETFYARVSSYASSTDLSSYTGPDGPSTAGNYADNGSIALSTTNELGVSAYVLESMSFCVSGQDIGKNCGSGITAPAAGSVIDPSMQLGETVGGVKALASTAVSTGNAYAQLSTNAAGGAVVNLKSNATSCGGLFRNGVTTNCDIPPQVTPSTGNVVAGTAGFGLEVGGVTSPTNAVATDMAGTLAATNNYNASKYFMDYVAGNASGVTGPYGSAIFDSAAAPVSNKNIPLTFGATISNNTPAGVYGAKLSLIATGTY